MIKVGDEVRIIDSHESFVFEDGDCGIVVDMANVTVEVVNAMISNESQLFSKRNVIKVCTTEKPEITEEEFVQLIRSNKEEFIVENLTGTFEIHRLDSGYKVKVYTEEGIVEVAEERYPTDAVKYCIQELINRIEKDENKEEEIEMLEERIADLKGE